MSHGSMAFTTVPSGCFVAVLTANYHWHGSECKVMRCVQAYRLEGITRRLQNLTLESRETENAGGSTALVTSIGAKKPFGNSEARRPTHEAKVNMSFINFLYTICLLLPTELKWDSIQDHLNLHIGKDEYKQLSTVIW
jgi:hypothetical protein